jgi:cyclic beta-1,2-glucan synthetase
MYRLGIEAILGITRVGNALKFNPCIPRNWTGFKVDYRFGMTHYKISVENPQSVNRGIQQVILDGVRLSDGLIPLADDGLPHEVRVVLG